MRGSLRFEQASRTDIGCVRAANEDACLTRADAGLWAVADGMGGHARGGWASAEIVAALDAAELPDDLNGAVDAAGVVLAGVNALIWDAGRIEGKMMGSTIATLLVRGQRYVVLWAGDSRVYRIRGGVLTQLTTDHSEVEEMVARGLLSREEAEHHPMAHMLSRAVGARPELALERRMGDVRPGDMFLLCSDGLTRMVPNDEIAVQLRSDPPHRAALALVDLALRRGAADNVTVVLVACDETTLVEMD